MLKEWVDFNDHMSACYFAVAFAECNDDAIEALGFGSDYRAKADCALYVVEARYRYRKELRRGDRFRIGTALAGADDKRLTLTHGMTTPDGAPVADAEILFLHVDRSGPRAAPFDPEIRTRLHRAAANPDSE